MFDSVAMPRLITGRGSVEFLATLNRKKIGVVSYCEAVVKIVEEAVRQSAAEVRCFAIIEKEPYLEDILAHQAAVNDFAPDLIVSIGGGSVIDTAKALHLFYEHPNLAIPDGPMLTDIPPLGGKAIHVAIPTTSGTGSEATSAAVFIDRSTMTKKLLLSNHLIPDIAVLDADFTDQLPDSIAIVTGLDALTHAIEASTAKNASPLIQSIALAAACDIFENLHLSISRDIPLAERLAAREKMHIASCMAGISITNSCTGIVHSYDHPGPEFGLPHGLVCGMMLPAAIKICGIQPAYLALARRLGIQGQPQEVFDRFLGYTQRYIQKLGVQTSFKARGIEKENYFAQVNRWAEISLKAFATTMSPANMTVEKGLRFFDLAYNGLE